MPKDTRRSHGPGNQSRDVLISKALSRLLRHSAVQDRIPIDSHGYVRLDHLMNWQRLKSMQPRPTMQEIIEIVTSSEKQRFGLKYEPESRSRGEGVNGEEATQPVQPEEKTSDVNGEDATTEEAVPTATQKAIKVFESGEDTELRHFFIRANQGHSLKSVEAENLLTPISLDDEMSVPQTVVHGTFYGAWENVLRDGGLKSMNRNHVHFSTGPPLEEVVKQLEVDDKGQRRGLLKKLMEENKVVSGMRTDANVLVYVDVKRGLEEGGMKWWRSENGVVLTDGVEGTVGTKYWEAAVEVKEGLGVIWEKDKGVVKELPTHLKGKALPFGKGRGGGKTGGGGAGRKGEKPKMKMEKDDLGDV